MDTHIAVRDVLAREFVGASESDTVPASSQLLLEEESNHLVVLRGNDPVGLVSLRDLLQQYVEGDATTATLTDVLTTEYETIDPDMPVTAAADRFVETSRPLLVVEDEEPIGLLTESDLLTVPQDNPYDDGILTDVGGSSGSDTSSEQGICEACGAFTRTLTVTDGQTLCSDCRDV